MTRETTLFTASLGLTLPWKVTDIGFDAEARQVDIDGGFPAGSRFAYPFCGAVDHPVHDTPQRRWHHLHFFGQRVYIHADVPRVRFARCGKASIKIWRELLYSALRRLGLDIEPAARKPHDQQIVLLNAADVTSDQRGGARPTIQ